MGILQRTERFMVRAMYVVQLKDSKRAKDLLLMFGMNKTTDQLAITGSAC